MSSAHPNLPLEKRRGKRKKRIEEEGEGEKGEEALLKGSVEEA